MAGSKAIEKGVRQIRIIPDPKTGEDYLEMDAKGIEKAALDVYCGSKKIKTVNLSHDGKTNVLRGGPVALCSNGRPFSLKGNIVFAEVPLPNPRENFVERPVDQPLSVNTDKKHYFSRRTREQGEKDLRDQVASAHVEDGFLFVEGLDESGQKTSFWYEIGVEEKPNGNVLRHTNIFIKAVQKDFSTITGFSFYHFHPKKDESQGPEYPSPQDIVSLFESALHHGKEGFDYPEEICDSRVITQTGVYQIKPDYPFISANKTQAGKYTKWYETFFFVYMDVTKRAFPDLTQAEKSKRFAQAASNPLVTITLIPHSPLTELNPP